MLRKPLVFFFLFLDIYLADNVRYVRFDIAVAHFLRISTTYTKDRTSAVFVKKVQVKLREKFVRCAELFVPQACGAIGVLLAHQ